MISKTQGKKLIINKVNNWFYENRYKFVDNGDGEFRKETEKWIYAIKFNFYSKSINHLNTTILMHAKEVESIILSCGLPNVNLESYTIGLNYLYTIQDKINLETFMTQKNKIKLVSEGNYIQWASLIVDYMTTDGRDFIEKFSCLPRILEYLDFLDQNKSSYLKILNGGIDHLFRALIISKLCNDHRFTEKQERFDSLILKDKYSNWHPHYQKLKQILKTTSPIYNIEES